MSKNSKKNNSKKLAVVAEDATSKVVALVTDPKVKAVKKAKRLSEEQICAKYPHAIAGTMRYETEGKHIGKQTIEAKLACSHIARVATSDLFQVKACPECKKPVKKAKAVKAEKAEAKPSKKPLNASSYNKDLTVFPTTSKATLNLAHAKLAVG